MSKTVVKIEAVPYADLRILMYSARLSQKAIGSYLGKTGAYVSQKLSGKREWKLSECYLILKLCGKQPEDLPQYFPIGGYKNEKPAA